MHATDIHLITVTEYGPILWVFSDSGKYLEGILNAWNRLFREFVRYDYTILHAFRLRYHSERRSRRRINRKEFLEVHR